MKEYLDLLRKVRNEGQLRPNRTGIDAYSVFGHQLRINLQRGFPLLTTKKIHFPAVVHELLWFISGKTNVRYLQDKGITIWDEWADELGRLGPIYGKQWRNWEGINGKQFDQLKNIINSLKQDPYSRRHIISAWNVAELDKMALVPCHILFQFFVGHKRNKQHNNKQPTKPKEVSYLHCHLYQRSADIFLGVPFNIAGYSLLTIMIAHTLGMQAGELVHSLGDVHLYNNHIDQADEQLSRKPLSLPQIELNPQVKDLFSFTYEDFKLKEYKSHPKIKASVAV